MNNTVIFTVFIEAIQIILGNPFKLIYPLINELLQKIGSLWVY
jgi:hypothetical protein